RLLAEMQDVPDEKRQAHYACAIACVLPDGREFTVYGECYGVIARDETGENGFGYDPLFYLPQYGVTFGELAPEIKNEISHRAKALKAFAEKIRTMEL
ncbi:MAG: non-canonical purine NTP pyrophosphatase, partial [Oscillospiraceae bacterium]|nr:non-canonical purine NTP pyrophosphatase [Oscillospiraceae bacterium]